MTRDEIVEQVVAERLAEAEREIRAEVEAHVIQCAECGRIFVAKRTDAVRCSQACAKRASRRRPRAGA